MAPTSSDGPAEDGVPHSVIQQAEAAITGAFNGEELTEVERRRSRLPKPDYSQYQPVRSKDGTT